MKNVMADKSKTYLGILILLIFTINSSAQKVSMFVHKSRAVIFEKEVAEIDSVKFYKTGILPSAQKETMFVYRDGIIKFQKYIYDIDSVTFSKSTPVSPLELTGTLNSVVLQGCSVSAAPLAVTTVTALEKLPGTVSLNEGCSGKANLTVTSEDIADGSCPGVIYRTYTVKDACNNAASVVQQFTIEDNTPPVVSGILTAVLMPGCSAASVSVPVTTVAALEQLPGAIKINDECTRKANLTVSSADVSSGTCPITVIRTYTVKDACNNSVSMVQQITISPEDQHIANAVLIPCGNFKMGSPVTEVKWGYDGSDETQHEVTLSAFYMSKYEVTNSEFAKFLNDKQIGRDAIYQGKPLINFNYNLTWFEPWGVEYVGGKWIPYAGYENHPVVFETWYGATEYAQYVGGRLPTEAEWEYACRAGTITPFSTGNCVTNLQANYDWNFPYNECQNSTTGSYHTVPVDSYAPNAWGLHNMHGNVGEWCSDWYGPYPSNPQINPTGSATGTLRVSRGGGNTNVAHRLRSAFRGSGVPEYGSSTTGFRVAFSCNTSN